MSSASVEILTTTSSDGTLAAIHVPTPSTGATLRHTVKLFDLAVTRQLKSTLVASCEAADGRVVQLALEQSGGDGDTGVDGSGPPSYLAARLSSETPARPDKVLIWDLHRGVVSCTISAPTGTHVRSVVVQNATLYALCVHHETGKVWVMEYDLSPSDSSAEGSGRLTRKVKCPSIDVEELHTLTMGLAVAGRGTGKDAGKDTVLAVRLGDAVRIMDGMTGKKLAKCKVRGDDHTNTTTSSTASTGRSAGSRSAAPLRFSSDAHLLALPTTSGLQIFSAAEGGKPLYTISNSGGQQPVSDAAMRAIEDGKYAVLGMCPSGGCAYLAEVGGGGKKGSGSKKGGNIAPLATIRCANDKHGVIAATFHGASPGNRVVVLAMPNTDGTGGGAGNAPSMAVGSVEVDEVSYRDEDGNMVQGEIAVGDADDDHEDMDDGGAGGGSKKKRALPSGELVLGPGETGGEALGVTDRASKRAKLTTTKSGGGDDEDDNDDANDDDGADEDEFVLPDDDATEEAAGATIADRLALLTSEMDREAADTDDESEDEEAVAALYGASGKGGKKKRKATSESLSTLLRQALSSNDDSQLEVALHVHDKKVIENSIATLAREDEEEADDDGRDDMITKLLGKLVDRLGRKPGRAEELSIWVQTVLLILISGKSMSRREREVAAKLAPLRSMLNERVESLPHLLRLEGRLSLLGQQL